MNSDPHETAAWRAFGMLDSNEAAGFDEAIRQDPELKDAYRDMNVLCAAVAAASIAPLQPRAGQLEQLQARLGLKASKSVNWLGISGWAAAAAAFAFMLLVDRKAPVPAESVKNSAAPHATKRDILMIQKATEQEPAVRPYSNAVSGSAESVTASRDVNTHENNVKLVTKIETKRLVQEIAVLREKLESIEKREQQRLEPVQGIAWPIVMKMRPPSAAVQIASTAQTTADAETSVVDVLGDALAGKSSLADNQSEKGVVETPSAVPIYDPATGAGTLVVNNLSNTNFWVTAKGESEPRLLGKIPPSNEAYESVGFELPVGTIPENFVITDDSAGKNAPPSDKNTILIGPQ